MIALVGDAELDEGNNYDCLQKRWKHGQRNCCWIIHFVRQSLDGVIREGLSDRIGGIFETFGWDVVTLKDGTLQQAAFAEPGGARLRHWIFASPNRLFDALTFRAHCLRAPGPSCEVVIACHGTMATEAIAAAGVPVRRAARCGHFDRHVG